MLGCVKVWVKVAIEFVGCKGKQHKVNLKLYTDEAAKLLL